MCRPTVAANRARSNVMDDLDALVVKEVNGSGGYGMLVGPHASAAQREKFAAKLKADPDNYIAQPTLALSTCPASFESGVSPRHVDLRPFVLSGADGVRIVPGGLTRVALKEGSLVVNSSQGGGTKDTWIVDDLEAARLDLDARAHRRQSVLARPLDGAGRLHRRAPSRRR